MDVPVETSASLPWRAVKGPRSSTLGSLVDELARRVPLPVDELELAAVIESIGITDDVAAEDFEAPDVFALAQQAFPLVRSVAPRGDFFDETTADKPSESTRRAEQAAVVRAAGMCLLLLAPVALLPVIVRILVGAGWGVATTAALMLGMSAAMLLLSGPTFAIGRRSAILSGFGFHNAARRYLRSRATWIMAIVAAAGALGVSAAVAAGAPPRVAAASATSAVTLGLTWALINVLLFAGRAIVTLVCVAAAAGFGAATGLIWRPVIGLYGAAGTLVVLLAISTILLDRTTPRVSVVPSRIFAGVESIPYATYGTLAVAFLLEPYMLGWLPSDAAGSGVGAAGHFGTALSVAVLPLALSFVFVDRAMRHLWKFMRSSAEREGIDSFGGAVESFQRRQIAIYARSHGVLSCTCVAVFLALAAETDLDRTIDGTVFIAAVAFYWLFGCTQFTALLMLNLSRPLRAAAPFAAGIAIAATAGVVTILFGSRSLIPVDAAAAAIVALAVSLHGLRKVTKDLGQVYSSAF